MTDQEIAAAIHLVRAWQRSDRGGLEAVGVEFVADSLAKRLYRALDMIAELQKSRELLDRLNKRGGLGIDVHNEINAVLGPA